MNINANLKVCRNAAGCFKPAFRGFSTKPFWLHNLRVPLRALAELMLKCEHQLQPRWVSLQCVRGFLPGNGRAPAGWGV